MTQESDESAKADVAGSEATSLDEQSPAAFPLEESPAPVLPEQSDAGTTRALAGLLHATPFIDLHRTAGGEHPWRRDLCFAVDFILRLVTWVLLVGVILLVAWKLLAPLPPLFTPPDTAATSSAR